MQNWLTSSFVLIPCISAQLGSGPAVGTAHRGANINGRQFDGHEMPSINAVCCLRQAANPKGNAPLPQFCLETIFVQLTRF